MMVSFYRPNKKRFKVVIEADAFPSDIYAIESHIKHHNLNPSEANYKTKTYEKMSLVIRPDDIEETINTRFWREYITNYFRWG